MEKTFAILQQLQDILSRKYSIEQEIIEIPKALETKIEILNRLKKNYVEKDQSFQKIKAEIKTLVSDKGEAERLREEFEKRMDIITTQREYEALDKEIHDAAEKEQRLRGEIQRCENDLKEMSSSLEREEEMIAMQEEELATENEKIVATTDDKKIALHKLSKEEAVLSPNMSEDMLFKFQRIIRNKSGMGIVPVKSNMCSGCYMVLPAQFVNEIRAGESIEFCPYCSRILFWEESAEVLSEVYEFNEEDVGGLADLLDKEENLD